MKSWVAISMALVWLWPADPAAGAGGVARSVHDFSAASWKLQKGRTKQGEAGDFVCGICHHAHSIAPPIVPLWSHETSRGPFVPYTSPTLRAQVEQPGSSSLACLSCHDGTVAVNQFAGKKLAATEAARISPESLISPDLHTVHPVSFVYDATLAANNGSVENPTAYKIGDPKPTLSVNVPPVPAAWEGTSLTGQTIDKALLVDHKMECSSCHDIHNMAGSAPSTKLLVKITGLDASGRGDLLCRTCHIK